MKIESPADFAFAEPRMAIPDEHRASLLPVARHVFWWGNPEEWMDDMNRFTAQVMVFGDWDDAKLTWKLLGDAAFRRVLTHPPAGVFDIKSWNYWHCVFQMAVPPLPKKF